MRIKGRTYVGGFILFLFVFCMAFVSFSKNVEVHASTTIFSGHSYDVYLTQPLDEKAIQQGKVYVTNEEGEKVEAAITLQPNHQSLSIENLDVGKYILHIESRSFQKAFPNLNKQTIEFEVIEKLESIQSVEELEKYLQATFNAQQRYSKYPNFDKVKEESITNNTVTESAGEGYSTTNNQVEEIDEGDIAITDGKYIYTTRDQQIKIVDAQNPQNLKNVSTIKLKGNGYPTQLMKEENYLIVVYDEFVEDSRNNKKVYYGGKTFTKVAIYDVSNASNPKLIKDVGQEGYINGVRKYEGVLYVVTNYTPYFWLMRDEGEELRPYIIDQEEMKPMEVKDIAIIPGSMETSYTIISAIDLKNLESKDIQTKGYLGSSSTLYMSKNALYLTAVDYGYMPLLMNDVFVIQEDATPDVVTSIIAPKYEQKTNIYKFSINGTNIQLTATGSVSGRILNQFSMDEYNGYFRIATTEGFAWEREAGSKNHLFLLDENLNKVGEVTNLARGERIYSTRFMGDKAYIVTFKETDPLFVIDLSDPKNPKVLGELKIPGFSNYLHPLDESHLIGIGYDTEQRMEPGAKEPIILTKGMKISLFDVSDFANPKEVDTEIIGGQGTYSEVQYNHKALFKNEQYHYYGFSVSLYEEGNKNEVIYKGSGALVYEITPEKGIQLKGNLITSPIKGQMFEEWESSISRLLYIGNTFYTVSHKEIKSYDLQTFEPIGRVKMK